jgi:hypothetical protein
MIQESLQVLFWASPSTALHLANIAQEQATPNFEGQSSFELGR